MDEIKQTINLVAWISIIAIAISAIAGWIAWSARRVQMVSKRDFQELQEGLRSIRDIEKKADRVVVDRVSEHLRSSLGGLNSTADLASAIITHPVFLEQVISVFKSRLEDPEDSLSIGLVNKIVQVNSQSALSSDAMTKIRNAISEHITDNISDLLEGENFQEILDEVLEELLPVIVKELLTSSATFRQSIEDAVVQKVTDTFENS